MIGPKRKLLLGVLAILLAGLTAFGFRDTWRLHRIRTATGEKKVWLMHDYTEIVYRRMSVGMTREEVLGILGPPQNTDSEYVWIWVDDSSKPVGGTEKWSDIFLSGHDGYYLLFYKEKLLTPYPYKCAEGGPWAVLQDEIGMTKEEAMRTLDYTPPIILPTPTRTS